ncbi:MAG TPA: helicase-related protein [Gemmatimonadaceae bacterium]|jgi:superfamily II DNA or RNA helicase|nr:helicase-related protein [Gemmatimonadaceae bacterium]
MSTATRKFTPGTLVRARGREWVVLPQSAGELLRLRPLSGSEDDTALLHLGLEPEVRPATFPWPAATQEGNQETALLLHDALRLALRRGAGPFRAFGQVDVTPRPYQLVPLMMALTLDPVRLLIADDVGLGKTIEAALIARELLDRGEIRRLAVLCPPHLVEQWVTELRTRFHLSADAVTAGSAGRLERGLPQGTSLFDAHPITVVSLDYIKSERRRDEFARSCPEAIIVDEAHTCTTGGGGRHQRYRLLAQLLEDRTRHAILCTATPHSGDETAFVRLLGLLDPAFLAIGEETGDTTAAKELTNRLARHLVQRRRLDIREWHEEHLFPRRESADLPYRLTGAWERFLESVLDYCEGVASSAGGGDRERRLAFWGTLALLRCVTSSPAAAARALRTRLANSDDPEAIANLEAQVFDLDADEGEAPDDLEPGANSGDPEVHALLAMAEALAVEGSDPKLATVTEHVGQLLTEGFSPVIFCHYVATAHYVGERLQERFPDADVTVLTGELPAEARRETIERLGAKEHRILVATDCLSEGINLQHAFDAVVHYDLSWNPTRHEQREGRVDRFGQRKPIVRATLLLGENNPVDGAVLEVILRKAKKIAERLGVPVPLPDDEARLTEALLKAVLLRRRNHAVGEQIALDLGALPETQRLDLAWRDAEERAKRAVTRFAQRRLKPDDVAPEFDRAQRALGDPAELSRFLTRAMARLGAEPTKRTGGALTVTLRTLPPAIRERLAGAGINDDTLTVTIGNSAAPGIVALWRSHPLVATLAETLLERTLETSEISTDPAVLGRTGAWATTAVTTRTVIVLARLRHELETVSRDQSTVTMVEEALPIAIPAGGTTPLTDDEATRLLAGAPEGTLPTQVRAAQIAWLESQRPLLDQMLTTVAHQRAEQLLADHRRVRDAADHRGRYTVRAITPVDVIGAWILLPPVR